MYRRNTACQQHGHRTSSLCRVLAAENHRQVPHPRRALTTAGCVRCRRAQHVPHQGCWSHRDRAGLAHGARCWARAGQCDGPSHAPSEAVLETAGFGSARLESWNEQAEQSGETAAPSCAAWFTAAAFANATSTRPRSLVGTSYAQSVGLYVKVAFSECVLASTYDSKTRVHLACTLRHDHTALCVR